MSDRKQYRMLGYDGLVCGSIWADRVEWDNSGSYWFYLDGEAVLTAWYGYIEHLTDIQHLASEELRAVKSGYEENAEAHEAEARAVYEANPTPKVEICQECNSPIIDGNPAGHRVGCESQKDIAF